MQATGDPVLTTVEDGVLRIVLNRPERRNSLDVAAVRMVVAALEAAATDDALRVIVLEGAGENFCSGADWVASNSAGPPGPSGSAGGSQPEVEGQQPRPTGERPRAGSLQRRTPLQAHRIIQLLLNIQLPVVAVIRGWTAGLGFQLALAADFAVAADTARFWEPFIERGFSPDSGSTWLLPRLVGLARARELLLLGRTLTGAEAASWGLIHASVPPQEVDPEAAKLIERLAAGPTVALGLAKWCLSRNLEESLTHALDNESLALELSSRTADFREGLAAFAERRAARFTGR
jgi:2-(1,2-epoxy-1,2-dihydrophenyl)acetyl-CoA isomerase